MKRFVLLACLTCIAAVLPSETESTGMKKRVIISLPPPKTKGTMSLEEAIQKRRSVRTYSAKELNQGEISQLLWAVQGITDKERGLRAAPSAGALYPLEIYLVEKNGVFYYNVVHHSLTQRSGEDVRSKLAQASWEQSFIAKAPISIVICVERDRMTGKYGSRGNRYVDIEVGHAAENLHLQAVAIGLASVPVGAFDDDQVHNILGLPEGQDVLYIIPIGYAK